MKFTNAHESYTAFFLVLTRQEKESFVFSLMSNHSIFTYHELFVDQKSKKNNIISFSSSTNEE
jgi:hypothetical protein